MVVVAKGQGQACGNTALRDPRLQPLPSEKPDARAATPPKQQTDLVPWRNGDKWWQKLSGVTVVPLCALLTNWTVSPQHSMPLALLLLSVCQEEGRQKGWWGLSG